ncbi:MAG: hypothetical protein F4Y91_07140 [Gemmatimonadetes bacterium]|nr:hypothetical protein [Gemmatimonadota bacterium]MXY81826.1 hypothetical protein [Gemmatimonadota bacterium]MYA21978.1 hypothetical protein [Gemmatimonadota bacterium]MYB72116.1 hypothetical protein [Gemmatimonadota bacterium]
MTENPQPLTQAQDHDRRIGRLEGIAEQLDRRLDSIERAVVEQGRQINARIDALEQRQSAQFRWLIGIQITTLIAIGSLLLSILNKLPG